jgi:hypothetical protein
VKRDGASAVRPRPIWRVLLASTAALGALAVLISLFPTYSPQVALGAAALWAMGAAAMYWGIHGRTWWHGMVYWNAFLLMMLTAAMRAWYVLLDRGPFFAVLVSSLVLHATAWAFPWLSPKVSAKLAREQLTPTTRMGRFVQAFSLSLIPGIGASVYLIQRLSEGGGLQDLDTVLIGILGLLLGVAGPQAISHQFWEKRPWAASPQDAQPRTPG